MGEGGRRIMPSRIAVPADTDVGLAQGRLAGTAEAAAADNFHTSRHLLFTGPVGLCPRIASSTRLAKQEVELK